MTYLSSQYPLIVIKEVSIQKMKVKQWVDTHGIHWSFHLPHHLEAGELKELWNWPLQDLTVALTGGWQLISLMLAYMIWNIWIWELRDRTRFVIPPTIVPNVLLAKFLLPITATLGPAGLEVFVYKGRMLPPRETHKNELNVETAVFISSCHWTDRQKVG